MSGVISLGIGEPDFVTPYHIRNAVINSLLDGETQYTANYGIAALREEIAIYLRNRFGLDYDPSDEVLVTVGGSEAVDIVMRGILSPGDEVLVPDPGYVSYQPCVVLAGAKAVPVPTREEEGFQLGAEEIRRAMTPATRALLLSYPSNPTGAVLERDRMEAIARVAVENDLIVVTDEIYNELTYGGFRQTSIAFLPGMRERTVTVNGFSKAFAMTGFRVGYICAPGPLIRPAAKIHQYTIMCASRPSQIAAIEALRQGREDGYADVEAMRESYDQRRRLMYKAFLELGFPCFEPRGAFYMFPCIRGCGLSSEEFCERLLKEHSVVCIPGTAFGEAGEGHIRCCYATAAEKINEAFERMRLFVGKLRSGQ